MKKKKNKPRNLSEKKDMKRARIHASMNCSKYRTCLDKVYKNGDDMPCLWCVAYDFEKDVFRKEIGMPVVNTGTEEFKLTLPY